MNSPTDNLFLLIQALTKDEKRYFKNSIKETGKSAANYIQLFDAIARQKSYNEVALKRKFRGERFAKQFSVAKNYLYNLLLKYLANYHAQKSIEDDILQGLRYVKILYDKKLAHLAKQQLQKIKDKAIKHEFYSYLVRILLWEFFLERSYLEFQDWDEAQFEQARNNIEECLQLERDYTTIRMEASAFVYTLKKKGSFRNYKNNLAEIVAHPLIQNCTQHPSDKVKIIGLVLQAAQLILTRAYEEALKLWLAAIQVYHQNLALCASDKVRYVVALDNALFAAAHSKKTHLFERVLAQVQPQISLSPLEQLRFDMATHKAVLTYHIRQGNFEQQQLNKALEFFQQNELPDIWSIPLLLTFALFHFGLEQYDEALDALEYITTDTHHAHEGILSFGLILKLLIYYEKDELLLMAASIRTVYYHLKKKAHLFEFEKYLLKCLTKAIQLPSKAEIIPFFQAVKAHLLVLQNQAIGEELEPYTYFNYIAWLEGKIQQKAFSKMAKDYAHLLP